MYWMHHHRNLSFLLLHLFLSHHHLFLLLLVSPLFADLKNLPPLLIQVGTDEILWDDACSFAEKAIKAGNDCTLEIYENMPHVFQLGADFVPESKEAVKKITTFINDKIN